MLACPDGKNLTIFGTRVQARSQLTFALRTLPSVHNVHYVSAKRQPDIGQSINAHP